MIRFHPHYRYLLPLGLLGTMLALPLSAADWQALSGNSPFGPTAAAPGPTAGELEFRGAVQEEDIYLVNLFSPATKTSQWLPVPGRAPGLEVQAYDEATGKLRVVQAGRSVTLLLKRASVARLKDNAPLKPLDPTQQVSAEAEPGVPDFLRELPPEARKILEEVRRRRAIRWPAKGSAPTPQEEPAPGPTPPRSPP